MSLPVLPNPSNFLGVALVVNRSRDLGPQFVFHYPPQILPCDPPRAFKNGAPDELDDDDVLLDQMTQPLGGTVSGPEPKADQIRDWNHDNHVELENGSHIVPWEYVAGYPTTDLGSILTPTRAYHQRLFQVSLDQLCFVSYPIYVPSDGIWRKKKKKQPKYQPPKSPENLDSATKDGQPHGWTGDIPQIETRDTAEDTTPVAEEAEEKKSSMNMFNLVFILNPKEHEAKELTDLLYTHIIKKINKAFKYSQQKCDFVWKESKRILTLKDKNREAKTKMSVLWKEILEVSSLAACMHDVYEAVSHNKIAALQLETSEGTITHSVQIPVPFYLRDLPQEEDVHSRGLWLTTANYFVEEDGLHDPEFLDRNFALLLMSDEKKIIAELQADADETTAAMIEFVRISKPTMSFYQISQGTALSPAQVRRYAQHFIFWRRGIAIPPLHARDVYVVSPNADLALLPRASQAWARAFPLAPPLPDFLAELSAAPRPYKWFYPSKNHRPAYLQMLAWLMRGGWVTQLCTFAYVVVWPEIRYEVDYELEAEELRVAAAAAASSSSPPTAIATAAPSKSSDGVSSASSPGPSRDSGGAFSPSAQGSDSRRGSLKSVRASGTDAHSPYLPVPSPLASPMDVSDRAQYASATDYDDDSDDDDDDDTESPPFSPAGPGPGPGTPSANETIAEAARLERLADREQRAHAERAAAFARRPRPRATDHPSTAHLPSYPSPSSSSPSAAAAASASSSSSRPAAAASVPVVPPPAHLARLEPYVIVDARRATGRDSHYLGAIGRRFRDPRVRAAWPVFWKYFDGRCALERVALDAQLGLGGPGPGPHQGLGLGGGGGEAGGGGGGGGGGAAGTGAAAGIGIGGVGAGPGPGGGMKRKEAWALLSAMSEHLICVRHW
ncbi:nitrogen permease regulator of amino acid transport activity 3-domain-containing protein [Xylariaceae sp. FL0804]|nr:nitrogen permease regulator of amino acid transport activity 3-domain-containing protein [Xylariaceae sp. FL0804]